MNGRTADIDPTKLSFLYPIHPPSVDPRRFHTAELTYLVLRSQDDSMKGSLLLFVTTYPLFSTTHRHRFCRILSFKPFGFGCVLSSS
jgi:hypothetical protein